MPLTPATEKYCDQSNVVFSLDAVPSEHAQLVVDVFDRCSLEDLERVEEGAFLAQLSTRMAQGDEVAKLDFVRRLIAFRNSDRLSELEAAILIARAKRLEPNGSFQSGATDSNLG